MVSFNHMWGGRTPLRIAVGVGALLIFLFSGGGECSSNSGGGGAGNIPARSAAFRAWVDVVDDGGVGGGQRGGWIWRIVALMVIILAENHGGKYGQV